MADKLQKSIPFLFYYEPFFADMFRIFNKVPTTEIPTAGVGVNKDGDIDFMYNPEWFEDMSLSEIYFICKHEIYHVLLGHIFERLRKPPMLWNIACDSKINEMIINESNSNSWRTAHRDINFVDVTMEKLREFVNKRKMISYESLIKECIKYTNDNHKEYKILGTSYRDKYSYEGGLYYFFRDAASEKIFDFLHDNIPPETFTDYSLGIHFEPAGSEEGSGFGSEMIKEIAKSKLEKQIKEIVDEASARGYGSVPYNIQQILGKLFAKKTVDWQTLLRYFVKTTIKGHKYRTIRKINKRFPYIHSGRKHRRYAKILVGVDESGSMSNELIMNLFGEIKNLADIVQFDVIPFDYGLDEKDLWTWKKGKTLPEYTRKRYGGTSFEPVSKMAGDHNYDGLIIVTDCEAPFPRSHGIKRMWLTDERGYQYCNWKERELVVCSPTKKK
jgi:predicted metal-dependent peptidase